MSRKSTALNAAMAFAFWCVAGLVAFQLSGGSSIIAAAWFRLGLVARLVLFL